MVALVCQGLISLAIRRFGWVRPNFKGDMIPAVTGLYIVAYGAIGAALTRFARFGSDPESRLYLIAILGFGLLGLADDLLGNREVGGFKGHFKKLLLERRLTTGAAKALGGGILALWLGYEAANGVIWLAIINSALIALAANTINLLDLRPGRALFAFFFFFAIVLGLTFGRISGPLPIIAVGLAAAGVAHFDTRGKSMLGDVGSNALGAVIGLTAALDAGPIGKIAVLLVFFSINVYSERRSITKLIASHPMLSWIDSKLGVR